VGDAVLVEEIASTGRNAAVSPQYDNAVTGAQWTVASVNNGNDSFTVVSGINGLAAIATGSANGTATDTAAAQFTGNTGTGSTELINGANSYDSQRSMVDSIVYQFNQPVVLAQAGVPDGDAISINVNSLSGGTNPGTAPTWTYNTTDGGATWVITFSGAGVVGDSIANGEYNIQGVAANVTAVSGGGTMAGNQSDLFYRLFGDNLGNVTTGRHGTVPSYSVGPAANNAFNGAFGSGVGQPNFDAYLDSSATGSIGPSANNLFNGDFGTQYLGFTATI
jgi:hypothetical protein